MLKCLIISFINFKSFSVSTSRKISGLFKYEGAFKDGKREGAGKIIYSLGGRVVSSVWSPVRNINGDKERKYMIVVQFPSEKVFQNFLDEASNQNIHELRENSTKDYIWTLYKPWDIKAWVGK